MGRDASPAAGRVLWPVATAWALVVLACYYRLLLERPSEALGWLWTDAGSTILPAFLVASVVAAAAVGWCAVATGRGNRPPVARRPGAVRVVAVSALLLVLVGACVAVTLVLRRGWPLPYFAEAVRRGALGVGGLALVAVDAYLLGSWVLRLVRLPISGRSERVLFRIAAGFPILSYASLVLAVLSAYRPWAVRIGLVGVAAVGLVLFGRSGGWRPRVAQLAVQSRDRPWVAVVGLALALSLVAALAPETEYDALWYHLWLPKLWLQSGRPVDLPHDYIALYPLTFELVYGAGLSTGGAIAAKLLHWLCLPLTALAALVMTRRFFPRASPWFAAAVFVTVPTVTWEATTSYIDLALAFYVTVGVYSLLRYVASERREWLVSTALCLGTAAAIKHLGLVVVGLAALGLMLRRLQGWREARRGVAAASAVVFVALAIAGPWYLRAWRASGNPFFPELYKVFGARPSDRWDDEAERGLDGFKARFGSPRTPIHLAMLPVDVTMHGSRFGGSLGPVFLLLLPALIVKPRRRPPATWWLVYLVAGYVAVWASPLGSLQLRFLVPVAPVLAVLSAEAIGGVGPAHRRARRAAAVLVAAVLLLNLPPFTPLHESDRRGWSGWLTHVVRVVPLRVVVGREPEDRYLRERVGTYGAWRFIDANAARDARVLEAGGGDEFYASRPRVSVDAIPARGMYARGAAGAPAARAALARVNAGYLLVEKGWMRRFEQDHLAALSPDFGERYLQLAYEDAGSFVYRVK